MPGFVFKQTSGTAQLLSGLLLPNTYLTGTVGKHCGVARVVSMNKSWYRQFCEKEKQPDRQ
jgi:hypothetical protein